MHVPIAICVEIIIALIISKIKWKRTNLTGAFDGNDDDDDAVVVTDDDSMRNVYTVFHFLSNANSHTYTPTFLSQFPFNRRLFE